MVDLPKVPLPKAWPDVICSSVVAVVAMAHHAITTVRGWCLDSPIARVRLTAEVERLHSEIAMLTEELRIKDARMGRVEPRRRPHYAPAERLAVLALKAARGWNATQAAQRMQLSSPTITSWLSRVDEDGCAGLVRVPEPANRFPEFVATIVRQLKATVPSMGKVRIAQTLARAGLLLSSTTVKRMLDDNHSPAPPPAPCAPDAEAVAATEPSSVVARCPGHVWGVDLTTMPTTSGFWVPWLSGSQLLMWPFGWWLVVVVDHFSREVLAIEAFRSLPSAADVCRVLDRCVAGRGPPKYVVTDQGVQF